MKRQDVLDQLSTHKKEIQQQFGVKKIAIFGSIARDEFTEDSDLDVMIVFAEGQATFANYMDLKFFLEDLFGHKVDLVTERSLRPAFRPYVERDLVAVT